MKFLFALVALFVVVVVVEGQISGTIDGGGQAGDRVYAGNVDMVGNHGGRHRPGQNGSGRFNGNGRGQRRRPGQNGSGRFNGGGRRGGGQPAQQNEKYFNGNFDNDFFNGRGGGMSNGGRRPSGGIRGPINGGGQAGDRVFTGNVERIDRNGGGRRIG